jgi:hypothetical protein
VASFVAPKPAEPACRREKGTQLVSGVSNSRNELRPLFPPNCVPFAPLCPPFSLWRRLRQFTSTATSNQGTLDRESSVKGSHRRAMRGEVPLFPYPLDADQSAFTADNSSSASAT